MVKLCEELVKLCMVCICKTRYWVRNLNCLSSQDLGGILNFYIAQVVGLRGATGKWPGEGPGTEKGQANSLPGRRGFHYFYENTLLETINAYL